MGCGQGHVRVPRRSRRRSAGWCSRASRPMGLPDIGPVICACFGVGLNAIRATLRACEAANVDDIGKALRAGTNCVLVPAGAEEDQCKGPNMSASPSEIPLAPHGGAGPSAGVLRAAGPGARWSWAAARRRPGK